MLLASAVASALLIFWLSLKSTGGDWYISETRADILYTGIHSFHEFPYFSFALNGGSYLLQDPEGPLLSPTALAILMLGPTLGLRVMTGLWAGLGVAGFVAWLHGRLRAEAALLGGIASVTSLAVMWKVAVGNDMFLWGMALPGVLWLVRRLVLQRTLGTAIALGMACGVLLLGPTFLILTYLFAPVLPIALIFELTSTRVPPREWGKVALLFALAGAVTCCVASPKIAAWLVLPMHRPTLDSGVLAWRHSLRALVNYGVTKSSLLTVLSYGDGVVVKGSWDVSEGAMALSPIATALALFGVAACFRKSPRRSLALMSLALVATGVALSSSWGLWSAIRAATHEGIRVAPRFLAVSNFGACVLVAIGAHTLLGKLPRASLRVTVGLGAAMFVGAILWVRAASRHHGESRNDTVQPKAIDVLEVFREERRRGSHITTFAQLVPLQRIERGVLNGFGVVDQYRLVGNDAEPVDWWRRPEPVPITGNLAEAAHVSRMSHLQVRAINVAPDARLRLKLTPPSVKFTVPTLPENLPIAIYKVGNYLVMANASKRVAESATIQAELPVSSRWFVLAGVTLAGGVAFLCVDRARRRNGPGARPLPPN